MEESTPSLLPLASRIRNRLFDQWVLLIETYRMWKVRKELRSDDPKAKMDCQELIRTLYIELKNYMDAGEKPDFKDGMENEIQRIGDILFKIGIIDATTDLKTRRVISDW